MSTIKEDYVSFETAKLLKEKGFNEKLLTFYVTDETKKEDYFELMTFTDDKIDNNHSDYCYLVPTLQMARKWLKEKYNIHIEVVHLNADRHTYYLYRYYSCQSERYVQHINPEYSTYEQACEAAIKYSLENLI